MKPMHRRLRGWSSSGERSRPLRPPRLLQRSAGAKLHPAARTFQALRILVNRELANLDRLLAVLPACLEPGGVAAIISFHSGEDRRVKDAFREGVRGGIYSEISRDPIIADEAEQRANPRSRSAKLR